MAKILIFGSRVWVSDCLLKFPDAAVFAQRSCDDNTPSPTWDVSDKALEEILDHDFEQGRRELFDNEIDFLLESGVIDRVVVFPIKKSLERAWDVLKMMRLAHARGIPVEVYYPSHDAFRTYLDQCRLDGLVWPTHDLDRPGTHEG